MNELNELNNLTTIGTNSRRGGQNFDIFHDNTTSQFEVGDAFYLEHNLDDNGFKFHVGEKNIYLSMQPNEESISYKGREGSKKGKSFKSSTTSELLTKVGLIGDLKVEEIGVKSEVMYYKLVMATPMTNTPEEVSMTEMVEETEPETQEELV